MLRSVIGRRSLAIDSFCSPERRRAGEIDVKLAELQQKTGRLWTCEVTRPPQSTDPTRFLEIAIEGQVLKPVSLSGDDDSRADVICAELERAYEEHAHQ